MNRKGAFICFFNVVLFLCLIISCQPEKSNNSIGKEDNDDSLFEEAKFWFYVINSNSHIYCFQTKENQKIDNITFRLKSKTITDSTIAYKFDVFYKDTFFYCNIYPSNICGVGFLKKNNLLYKYPIYKNLQFGHINDTAEINQYFRFADISFKKVIISRPNEILQSKEFRKMAIKRGYIDD